jgi:Family of unknown function (DUF6636)
MRLLLLTVSGFVALAMAPPAHAAPVSFESPSHNIGCYLAKSGVRCDIRAHTWKPPPKPKSCDLDWGNGLEVGRRGFGRWVCAGDTVLGGERVLGYRESLRRGRFQCTSYRNGMRCVNLRTDHGFKLARRKASWF